METQEKLEYLRKHLCEDCGRLFRGMGISPRDEFACHDTNALTYTLCQKFEALREVFYPEIQEALTPQIILTLGEEVGVLGRRVEALIEELKERRDNVS